MSTETQTAQTIPAPVINYGFIIRTEDDAVIIATRSGISSQEEAEDLALDRIDYEESTWLYENLSAEITCTVSTTHKVNTVSL